jgi:hypothetical protein
MYVKGLLDGLALPHSPEGATTLTAIVTPPTTDSRTDPRAYVWGSHGRELRETMPRAQPGQTGTGAFKHLKHELDIWIICFGDPLDAEADSAFPAVIEEIMQVLRNTLMPVQNVVDNNTGRTSTILVIGEDMTWDYGPVHVIADQRIFRYDARIVASITESIQA